MNQDKRNKEKNNKLMKRCNEIACPLGYHDYKECPYNHYRNGECYCAYQTMCNNNAEGKCHYRHDYEDESYLCPFWVKGYCRLHLEQKCRFIHPCGQAMPEKLLKLRKLLIKTKSLMKEQNNKPKNVIVHLPRDAVSKITKESFAQVCAPHLIPTRREIAFAPPEIVPGPRKPVKFSYEMLTEIAEGKRQFPEDEFWRLNESGRARILEVIVRCKMIQIGDNNPMSDVTISFLQNHRICVNWIMKDFHQTLN